MNCRLGEEGKGAERGGTRKKQGGHCHLPVKRTDSGWAHDRGVELLRSHRALTRFERPIHVHTCTFLSVEARVQRPTLSITPHTRSTLVFEIGFLTGLEVSPLMLGWLTIESQRFNYGCLANTGTQVHITSAGFFMGILDSNSGPEACVATLLSYLSQMYLYSESHRLRELSPYSFVSS